jgi:hypothetical protein
VIEKRLLKKNNDEINFYVQPEEKTRRFFNGCLNLKFDDTNFYNIIGLIAKKNMMS